MNIDEAHSVLFSIVDFDKDKKIGRDDIQIFARRFDLPATDLADVWDLVDTACDGHLTSYTQLSSFCMTASETVQSGTVPSSAMPAASSFDALSAALDIRLRSEQKSLRLNEEERTLLTVAFEYIGGSQKGFIDGETARSCLKRSGVGVEFLSGVWFLADMNEDNAIARVLSLPEFMIAVRIAAERVSSHLFELPMCVPSLLLFSSFRARVQVPPMAKVPRLYTWLPGVEANINGKTLSPRAATKQRHRKKHEKKQKEKEDRKKVGRMMSSGEVFEDEDVEEELLAAIEAAATGALFKRTPVVDRAKAAMEEEINVSEIPDAEPRMLSLLITGVEDPMVLRNVNLDEQLAVVQKRARNAADTLGVQPRDDWALYVTCSENTPEKGTTLYCLSDIDPALTPGLVDLKMDVAGIQVAYEFRRRDDVEGKFTPCDEDIEKFYEYFCALRRDGFVTYPDACSVVIKAGLPDPELWAAFLSADETTADELLNAQEFCAFLALINYRLKGCRLPPIQTAVEELRGAVAKFFEKCHPSQPLLSYKNEDAAKAVQERKRNEPVEPKV